jgi:parallel beta-helix repeat protein
MQGKIENMVEYQVGTLAELMNILPTLLPGDVVRIRGGTYQPIAPVLIQTSGVTFEAYPNEKVVFDGSLATYASLGDYWEPPLLCIGVEGAGDGNGNTLRNIEVRNNPVGEGIRIYGSDNVFDHVESHHNSGSGFDSVVGRNQFLYCVAHHNADPQATIPGGDADGFTTQGNGGNYFLGCESYMNSDDGIDLWASTGNIVENCVCHHNGLLQGDGLGFKTGNGGNSYKKCIAYSNRSAGYSTVGTPNNVYDHCTGYSNGQYEFVCFNLVPNTYTNNIGALQWWDQLPTEANNSWNLDITNPGYASIDPTSPDFLSLRADSPCRGKASDGTDIGALQYGEKISDLLGMTVHPVQAGFNWKGAAVLGFFGLVSVWLATRKRRKR